VVSARIAMPGVAGGAKGASSAVTALSNLRADDQVPTSISPLVRSLVMAPIAPTMHGASPEVGCAEAQGRQ
jgi:hypothetical protein